MLYQAEYWIGGLVVAALLVQLAWMGLITLGLWRIKPSTQAAFSLPVSVVIAVKNEAANIPGLLAALQQQQYTRFEVVLVDDHSSDNTLGLLQAASLQDKRLRVLSLPCQLQGKKAAIQYGIACANNPHYLFTDADCHPGPAWIATLASGFTTGAEVVLGYSPYLKAPGWLNALIRYDAFVSASAYLAMAQLDFPYMAVGRNMGYTAGFYNQAQQYITSHRSLSGVDDVPINQLGYKVRVLPITDPAAQVPAIPKNTLKAYIHQKARHLGASPQYTLTSKAVLAAASISQVVLWPVTVLWVCAGNTWTALALLTWAMARTYMHQLASKKLCTKPSLYLWLCWDLSYTVLLSIAAILSNSKRKW